MTKKTKKKSISNYLLLTSIFLIIGLAWGVYKFFPRQSADIFVVSELPTGETTIVGLLQKDAAIEDHGYYYLVTDDGSVIALDIEYVDSLINQKVQVTGSLAYSEQGLPYITNPAISLAE